MKKLNKKQKDFLGKIIRLKELKKKRPRKDQNIIDPTNPGTLLLITIAYAVAVFFIIIGVPWHGSESTPIPPEDLPVAIPLFIILYVVVIGGLYLYDKVRK